MDIDVKRYESQLIEALQKCIQYRSVRDLSTAGPGAPFGEGIRACLEWTLELGKELGFKTRNFEGYAGHIEMGNGPLLGILGHLDVVPEGDGWSVDPYQGVIKDGKLYGRGARDDKGPLLAALFAMKAVHDAGLPLKRTVRLIIGTDEESEWLDMEHYKKHEEMPQEGFSPDAQFPVINAEKGCLHLEFVKDLPVLPHILAMQGGLRPNVVPDTCTVVLQDLSENLVAKAISKLPTSSRSAAVPSGIQWERTKNGELRVTVKGQSAHASTPEKGTNAVILAFQLLSELPLSSAEKEFIDWILAHLGRGVNGEGFGIEFYDEPSGKLTTNIGIFELQANRLRMVVDIRYPVTKKKEDVLNPVKTIADQVGLQVNILNEQAPHFVPAESKLVRSLLKAYADVTGLKAYSFGIGGGTYAKLMPQGVAFGPSFPGKPEPIHCPDEYIAIDDLILALKVYTQAIINLAC